MLPNIPRDKVWSHGIGSGPSGGLSGSTFGGAPQSFMCGALVCEAFVGGEGSSEPLYGMVYLPLVVWWVPRRRWRIWSPMPETPC